MDSLNQSVTDKKAGVDPRLYEKIPVLSPTDKYRCHITGVNIMSGGRLVMIDFTNDCVKLFNSKHELTDTAQLPGGDHLQPLDIAVVGNNTLIVNCHWKRKLQLVSVAGDRLSMGETFDHHKSYRYHGVAYFDKQLIVTDNGRDAIKILDMTGRIVRRLKTGNSWQGDIVVNANEGIMYVANGRDNSVMCMGIEGQLLCSYKHERLCAPKGVFVNPNGMQPVCLWLVIT